MQDLAGFSRVGLRRSRIHCDVDLNGRRLLNEYYRNSTIDIRARGREREGKGRATVIGRGPLGFRGQFCVGEKRTLYK
jgi:hypothetical protein